MKTLNKFKKEKETVPCDFCMTTAHKELCSVSIRTYDVTRRYVGSNLPIVGTYKMKLCPECYKKTMSKMEKLMADVYSPANHHIK